MLSSSNVLQSVRAYINSVSLCMYRRTLWLVWPFYLFIHLWVHICMYVPLMSLATCTLLTLPERHLHASTSLTLPHNFQYMWTLTWLTSRCRRMLFNMYIYSVICTHTYMLILCFWAVLACKYAPGLMQKSCLHLNVSTPSIRLVHRVVHTVL